MVCKLYLRKRCLTKKSTVASTLFSLQSLVLGQPTVMRTFRHPYREVHMGGTEASCQQHMSERS